MGGNNVYKGQNYQFYRQKNHLAENELNMDYSNFNKCINKLEEENYLTSFPARIDSISKVNDAKPSITDNHINIAEDYSDWLKIGMALYNTFGEEGRSLYHIISSQSNKYDFDKCNRNYDNMGYFQYDSVNIKSLFYIYNREKKKYPKKSSTKSLTKFNSVG